MKKRNKMNVFCVQKSKYLVALSMIAVNSLFVATAAHAEDVEYNQLETIVIRGQKIDKNINEVSGGVTVIDGEKLLSSEIQDVNELATQAPNVVLDSFGNISIRGVSGGGAATGGAAFITGSRARISTVVDGTTQDWSGYNFTPSTLWDIDQIEIMRGPQSTTQGASAMAGSVVINTNDPSYEQEVAVRAAIDHYDNGNIKHNLAFMVSGPMIEDELAYRIAIDTSKGDGWVNYEIYDYDVPNLSESESINVRGKLLWEPKAIPELAAKLTVNYHKNEGEHSNFVSNTEHGIATQTADITEMVARVQDSDEDAIALDVDYQLTSAWSNILHLSYTDTDIYADGYYGNSGLLSLSTYLIEQESAVFENRIVYNPENKKLKGVFGLYIANKDSLIDANQNGFAIDTEYTTTTTAAYAEATYALSVVTKLTAGLRIENEDIDKAGSLAGNDPLDQDSNETYVLPKLALTYAVNNVTTLGASVTMGYSPAGTGIGFNSTYTGFEVFNYDSEEVISYELSSKSYFANGSTLNANLFYNDYNDYQALTGLMIENVKQAHIYGFELEGTTPLTDSLDLFGSIGLLQSEVDESDSYEGNNLSSAPDSNLAIGLNQYIGENWLVGADITYVGGYYSDLDNSSDNKVGDVAISNARIQYTNGDFTVNGYVKNLTNEDAVYYRAGSLASAGQTRTFGLNVIYRM